MRKNRTDWVIATLTCCAAFGATAVWRQPPSLRQFPVVVDAVAEAPDPIAPMRERLTTFGNGQAVVTDTWGNHWLLRIDATTDRFVFESQGVRYTWDGAHLWRGRGAGPAVQLGPVADQAVGDAFTEFLAGFSNSQVSPVAYNEWNSHPQQGYEVSFPFAWAASVEVLVYAAGTSGDGFGGLSVYSRTTREVLNVDRLKLDLGGAMAWDTRIDPDFDTKGLENDYRSTHHDRSCTIT